MEYASKAIGNAGLTTGIIGTALGALGGSNGLNLLGTRNSDETTVTRHEVDMIREIMEKDRQIALLEADKYTDQKIADFADRVNTRFAVVEGQIAQQATWNATQTGLIGCIQGQIAQLQSMTKVVIPNSSVMPGWGNVTITPGGSSTVNATTNG